MISINHSQDLVGLADISVHHDPFSSFISKSYQSPKVKTDTPNQKLIQTLLIFRLLLCRILPLELLFCCVLCGTTGKADPTDAGAEIIYHFWHLVAESQ